MANYLNSIKPFSLFKSERSKPYFVDKSLMIKELLPLVQAGGNYVCITRPRRFGKTLMACMLASYFQKGRDSETIFRDLKIEECDDVKAHRNRYDVIYITLNEIPKKCETYEQYIDRIEGKLLEDLKEVYPECIKNESEALWDILNHIYEKTESGFVFILDEWDYIFHRDFVSGKDRAAYVEFLSNLLKGQPYVSMAYMTGILPISKYSSGSELNMFLEYTMATKEKYSEYFGFYDEEVDQLYQRYLNMAEAPNISREELRFWYDGYHTPSGRKLYNPRSVVSALSDNQISSYWTSSGPYDEIFSAMVVYGFLSYEKGYVDFIFYPVVDRNEDGIILELKVDSTPEEAIRQIKEKKYALRFMPKAGEPMVYCGRILAVGIAYDKKSKKHDCRVEVL